MPRLARRGKKRRAPLLEWQLHFLVTGKPPVEGDDGWQGYIGWLYFAPGGVDSLRLAAEACWRDYRETIIAAHPTRQPWALTQFG